MQTSAMSLFNERVTEKLQSDGLTIKDLADKIGMHRQALSKILNGHVDTTMGNAERIAEGLGVSLYELIRPAEPSVKRRKPEPQAA